MVLVPHVQGSGRSLIRYGIGSEKLTAALHGPSRLAPLGTRTYGTEDLKRDPQEVIGELVDSLKEKKGNEKEELHPGWKKLMERYAKSDENGGSTLSVDALTDGLRGSVIDSIVPTADKEARAAARVLSMVRHFQKMGHFHADIDPLGLPQEPPYITASRYRARSSVLGESFPSFGLTMKDDYNREISLNLPATGGLVGTWELSRNDRRRELEGKYMSILPSPDSGNRKWTCGQLYERLKQIYCGSIGLEYLHIHDRAKINWLRNQMELPEAPVFSPEMKKTIFDRTLRAVMFEKFVASKFATLKRFGLDGCESLVVAMEGAAQLASLYGLDSMVICMSHRGRLNTLSNVMKKPMVNVFSEFMGHTGFGGQLWGNTGDVKYHMGAEYEYMDPVTKREMLISVPPNPSHLEAVDGVLLGTVKARQRLYDDPVGHQVLPVCVHGDASIAGQGVVYEMVQMSELPGYSVGGTIHIVVNNQIGFTTSVADAGSGNYCTDLAKVCNAPIFHVNADDPEAVTRVMEIAFQYRQKFKSDVFIDLVGYRRYGHNELDMPKFTNPYMYQLIDNHPNLLDIYSSKLEKEKVMTKSQMDEAKKAVTQKYEEAYAAAKNFRPTQTLRPYNAEWKDMNSPNVVYAPRLTGLPEETLRSMGSQLAHIPKEFSAHPTISRVYKQRLDSISGGKGIDFGTAEALAFGSLLRDGFSVRLAGQDVERGTFSHRHAVLHDQKYPGVRSYTPLKELAKKRNYKGKIDIHNSLLSENAALAFEYGYSLENPNNLVIWEAQFGDFANGAQVVIDQFVTSGEVKWNHPSGLVMMLPHGYDGQGPEHSSARLERFLQLCDDREDVIHPEHWDVNHRSVIQNHNIQVVQPSNAANLFHVLRRQMHRGFRKPLVLLNSKKLLRLRDASSTLDEFVEGTRFRRYISDPLFAPAGTATPAPPRTPEQQSRHRDREKVERIIFCSGQIYYDLFKAREALPPATRDKIILARIEQLSPLPIDAIVDEINAAPNLASLVWAQEEPMNMGAWTYIRPRLYACLAHCKQTNVKNVTFAGRNVCAAPATGDLRIHNQETATLVKHALDLNRIQNSYYEDYLKK